TVARIREALSHDQPLVRQAACAALGRIADPDSVHALAAALGDPAKAVRHAAAWALRQIATRRGKGIGETLLALSSSDDPTREGGSRIVDQPFRYLADRSELAKEVTRLVSEDPVALVRMEAAQATWRWWYWAKEEAQKVAFEKAIIERLGVPEHP